jgi:hypothetical protein
MKRFKDLAVNDKIYVALDNRYEYGAVKSVLGGVNAVNTIKFENGYLVTEQECDMQASFKVARKNIIGQVIFCIPSHKLNSDRCLVGKFFLFTSKKAFKQYLNESIERMFK